MGVKQSLNNDSKYQFFLLINLVYVNMRTSPSSLPMPEDGGNPSNLLRLLDISQAPQPRSYGGGVEIVNCDGDWDIYDRAPNREGGGYPFLSK